MKIEDLSTLGKDSISTRCTRRSWRDLMQENRLFLDSVLFEAGGDRSLRTLLGARYGFLNGKTGRLYAVAAARGGELKRTPLPAGQRRGLFTQAAFLAARADADATRPVDSGSFVREEVLCAEVPPPPDEFKFYETRSPRT